MDEYILFCTNDRIGKAGDENPRGLSKMSKTDYTAQQKTGPFFRKQTFFIDFQLLITTLYLVFFSARQISVIILNESSKSTENALIE
jgi:hypothetical protein